MGQATLSVFLDVLVVALLVPTIIFAVILNGRLAVLRRNREELSRLVAAFNEATVRAEAGIPKLRRASEEVSRSLQEKVERAQLLRDDLAFMVERAEAATAKMEASLRNAKVDLTRPEAGSARTEANRSDAARAEAGRGEAGRVDPTRPELALIEAAKGEISRAEANRGRPALTGAAATTPAPPPPVYDIETAAAEAERAEQEAARAAAAAQALAMAQAQAEQAKAAAAAQAAAAAAVAAQARYGETGEGASPQVRNGGRSLGMALADGRMEPTLGPPGAFGGPLPSGAGPLAAPAAKPAPAKPVLGKSVVIPGIPATGGGKTGPALSAEDEERSEAERELLRALRSVR